MENMRPQYIYDALLIQPMGPGCPAPSCEIPVLENGYETVLDSKKHRVEQPDYELMVIRWSAQGCHLSRRIEFSRTDLLPHRQRIYDLQGNVATDAHYLNYKEFRGTTFPTTIEIERPRENYDITLNMVKLELNQALTDDQFALEQPAGAEVVRLGANHSRPQLQRARTDNVCVGQSKQFKEKHDESHDRRESGASAGPVADQHCGRGARSHADSADRGAVPGAGTGLPHAHGGHWGGRDRAAAGIVVY